jgi:hypothetical protein
MCLTVFSFQENKPFGASYHLHSSSDVREVVSRTIRVIELFKFVGRCQFVECVQYVAFVGMLLKLETSCSHVNIFFIKDT